MTTHVYTLRMEVRHVPTRVIQADLDRAVKVAVEHSTARSSLEGALAFSRGLQGTLHGVYPEVVLTVVGYEC